VHFIPLHLHPYYRDRFGHRPDDFPHATKPYRRIISLPIYPKMTQSNVEQVIDAVRNTAAQQPPPLMKRTFDMLVAAIGLVLFVPLFC
jgi:dTDP-4-amino-4,6-dideoxygalactose transaminase